MEELGARVVPLPAGRVMDRRAVVVFMRYPQRGEVKTRLAASIGAFDALDVHIKLAHRTLGVLEELKTSREGPSLFLFYTPRERREAMEIRYEGPWALAPQQGGHLGDRMARAFDAVMARGFSRVILTGSDIADVRPSDFLEAFRALDRGEAVLGPAADGGFYLAGLPRSCPAAFDFPDWGTPDVCSRTLGVLRSHFSAVHLLQERRDVDREEDLEALREDPYFRTRLSVVIPTLETMRSLSPLVDGVGRQLWLQDEILVVQGRGGHEGGVREEEAAEPLGGDLPGPVVRRLRCPPGRGLQLDAGGRAASGDLLAFLHDDCRPPADYARSMRRAASNPRMSLGCFRLAFQPSTPLLKAIARWAHWRTRRLKTPYGDQGFFCRREIFEAVGGFRKPYLMEDVDFARRCGRLGSVAMLPSAMTTSSRRYLRRGVLRASLENHLLLALHGLGVDDGVLKDLYYSGRGAERRDEPPL